MDLNLTDIESTYFNDLFCICDSEKLGKITYLKSLELFRSTNISNDDLLEIFGISGISNSCLYLTRNQFYSCLKLIGAHQAAIPLREEILFTTDSIQVPLPKFSWNLDLEPPPQIVNATSGLTKSTLKSLNTSNSSSHPSSSNGTLRSPDLIQLSNKESHNSENINSDLPSTDSEVEQTETENERGRGSRRRSGGPSAVSAKTNKLSAGRGGSPETWSTGSESPTPTNSVAERPWAVGSQSWQGLLCEEQRQLLGTEEESSDKHSSSDEEDEDIDLEALYQITPEQKDYYVKQFRAVQPDVNGLLSGVVAKVFFEKSRIPVEELRHIWQLCDVTRDGALDLAEFTSAMHLVVLRRNNIPIPSTLPTCLQPSLLHKHLGLPHNEAAEADLLNLEITAIDGASSGDGLTSASDKGNKEWTKFTESPTSNVSSPGPKPVNVTQSIVSDTHVIHPVPLRVTPVGKLICPEVAEDDAIRTFRKADSLVYESGIMKVHRDDDGDSPKLYHKKHQAAAAPGYNLHQRDSLPTDLRAIQRPQPKKPASKNIGAIPFLPEANQNISSSGVTVIANVTNNSTIILSSKKEAPPLPPPRPHRHTRSSSLDLQKLKGSNTNVSQEREQVGPPPEMPPPRISDKKFKMPSCDTVDPPSRRDVINEIETSFADFTQFPDSNKSGEYVTTIRLDSSNPTAPQPQPRSNLTNTLQSFNRNSAFEVYRKPSRSNRNSQSPQQQSTASVVPVSIQTQQSTESNVSQQEYEKRVTAISDNLRQVRFKASNSEQNSNDVLKHLKEQNVLLMRLCNDLSDELMVVQRKKEEAKTKLDLQHQQPSASGGFKN
ncbi:unnamed protein product [Diamesa serratosioi]